MFLGMLRAGNLRPRQHAYLSDANQELIAFYRLVQHDPAPLFPLMREHVRCHELEPHDYYRHQRRHLWPDDPLRAAARFLYLRKAGFQGLYRVNKQGGCNVSPGNHDVKFEEQGLLDLHEALQFCSLSCASFEAMIEHAGPGSFLYCDPPYHPGDSGSFTAYTKEGFEQDQQEALAVALGAAADRGASWLLSQSDTPWVRERFTRFEQIQISTTNRMLHRTKDSTPRNELLVRHLARQTY